MNPKTLKKVLLHLLVWIAFFTVPAFMNSNPHPPAHPPPDFHPDFELKSSSFWLFFYTLKNVVLVPLFYFNTGFLLPRLVPSKKLLLLFLSEVALALALFSYTQGISEFFFPSSEGGPNRFAPLLGFAVVLSAALAYDSYRKAAETERRHREQQTETLQSELQFLRWQISPHFLFNALNNMVALARKKSDLLESMLLNLSGLMRYMLYDTATSVVTLQKEARYLESYIHLQSIRYDNVKPEVKLHTENHPDAAIEPMLLIPFVENAFKHGIDGVAHPGIWIEMQLAGRQLLFTVRNTLPTTKMPPNNDARGIGLINVKKRLQLLYPNRHTLEVREAEFFTVLLKIDLF